MTTISPSEALRVGVIGDLAAPRTAARIRALRNAIRRRAALIEEYERLGPWWRDIAEGYANAVQGRLRPLGGPYGRERRALTAYLARATRQSLSFGYRVYELEEKNRVAEYELSTLTLKPYLL